MKKTLYDSPCKYHNVSERYWNLFLIDHVFYEHKLHAILFGKTKITQKRLSSTMFTNEQNRY